MKDNQNAREWILKDETSVPSIEKKEILKIDDALKEVEKEQKIGKELLESGGLEGGKLETKGRKRGKKK